MRKTIAFLRKEQGKMRITNNQNGFYTGVNLTQGTKETDKAKQQTGNRFFAGTMSVGNSMEDRVEQKREEAMQEARKLLGDVFAAEKTIDDDLQERANRIQDSQQSIVDANKALSSLQEEQEELKEQYGITGEETEEELPEEYKMQRDELNRYGEPYHQTIAEAQDVIKEETAIIAGVKLERLKSSPMVAASKEADAVLEAAEKEILGMYMEAGKETIDEKMEENEEKQEKLEEEKELEEAKQKEREEKTELPEVTTKQLLKLDSVKTEMKQEVDTMLANMKLVAEDIKGSMVDTEV